MGSGAMAALARRPRLSALLSILLVVGVAAAACWGGGVVLLRSGHAGEPAGPPQPDGPPTPFSLQLDSPELRQQRLPTGDVRLIVTSTSGRRITLFRGLFIRNKACEFMDPQGRAYGGALTLCVNLYTTLGPQEALHNVVPLAPGQATSQVERLGGFIVSRRKQALPDPIPPGLWRLRVQIGVGCPNEANGVRIPWKNRPATGLVWSRWYPVQLP